MELEAVCLRLIGAFYAGAGFFATRAGLMSHFLDRAISAISLEKQRTSEKVQTIWLLMAATIILAGGLFLLALSEMAAPIFLVSALGQALYIVHFAPRYFDVGNTPDPRGRQRSVNALAIYAAATAFVVWAFHTGQLLPWSHTAPLVKAALLLALAAHAGYVLHMLSATSSGRAAPWSAMPDDGPAGDGEGVGYDDADTAVALRPDQSMKFKVMAEYDAHPLWALDDGHYGDVAPEDLHVSPELTRDLNAWAAAYTASLNRDDPAAGHWSDEEHHAHAAQARPLAARLARERPELRFYIPDGPIALIEIPGGDTGSGTPASQAGP